LDVYDFDGTLFRSPEKPVWWKGGWWGNLDSLTPPCVPEQPSSDWWNGSVVEAAKRSLSNPDTRTIFLTGRIQKFSIRVKDLLRQAGLPFDEMFFAGGGATEKFKLETIKKILGEEPTIRGVSIWEDRGPHLRMFADWVESNGRACFPHLITVSAHPIDCPPPEAERLASATVVAARYKSKSTDDEGNVHYEYSDRQVKHRHNEKAKRVEQLRKDLGDLRKKLKTDLVSKDDSTALAALAAALIDETCERVGNDESAKEGHFGVTGWQKKHVSFSNGKATLKYVGKSGVKHEKTVESAPVVKALKELAEGKKDSDVLLSRNDVTIKPEQVNDYLSEFGITAKDIRGLRANQEMCKALKEQRRRGPDLPRDRSERDKILKTEFKDALDEVADTVGHEPATLRSDYLVPGLEDAFMKDGTVLSSFKEATKTDAEREDEAVEALLKPDPKKKPPRDDLRNRMVREKDDDLDRTDDDLSLNYKKVAFRFAGVSHLLSSIHVASRYLFALDKEKDDAFLEDIEGQTFTNPETKERVQFGSLPPEEQKKIRAQWDEYNAESEKEEKYKKKKKEQEDAERREQRGLPPKAPKKEPEEPEKSKDKEHVSGLSERSKKKIETLRDKQPKLWEQYKDLPKNGKVETRSEKKLEFTLPRDLAVLNDGDGDEDAIQEWVASETKIPLKDLRDGWELEVSDDGTKAVMRKESVGVDRYKKREIQQRAQSVKDSPAFSREDSRFVRDTLDSLMDSMEDSDVEAYVTKLTEDRDAAIEAMSKGQAALKGKPPKEEKLEALRDTYDAYVEEIEGLKRSFSGTQETRIKELTEKRDKLERELRDGFAKFFVHAATAEAARNPMTFIDSSDPLDPMDAKERTTKSVERFSNMTSEDRSSAVRSFASIASDTRDRIAELEEKLSAGTYRDPDRANDDAELNSLRNRLGYLDADRRALELSSILEGEDEEDSDVPVGTRKLLKALGDSGVEIDDMIEAGLGMPGGDVSASAISKLIRNMKPEAMGHALDAVDPDGRLSKAWDKVYGGGDEDVEYVWPFQQIRDKQRRKEVENAFDAFSELLTDVVVEDAAGEKREQHLPPEQKKRQKPKSQTSPTDFSTPGEEPEAPTPYKTIVDKIIPKIDIE
jgi:DNA topoisomerase-1